MSATLAAAAINWTEVLVALITVLPAIVAALYAGRIHSKIRTPSGTPIGKQIEGIVHTTLANNYHLRSIGNAVSAPTSPEAHAESRQVPDLPESGAGTKGP